MLGRSNDLVWRASSGVILDSTGDELRRVLATQRLTFLQAADKEIQTEVTCGKNSISVTLGSNSCLEGPGWVTVFVSLKVVGVRCLKPVVAGGVFSAATTAGEQWPMD